MSSQTVVMRPVVAALDKARDIAGEITWCPSNEFQERFLKEHFYPCLEDPEIPEIESMASWRDSEINAFLAKHGFDLEIRLDDNEFGIASKLELLVQWYAEGTKTHITCPLDKKSYEAVSLSRGLKYRKYVSHPHPVVTVQTKSEDLVHMTKLSKAPAIFDQVAFCESLTTLESSDYASYDKLIFPMVDLNRKDDVTWIVGLSAQSPNLGPISLSKAEQQSILKMNEKGALAKSAFVGGIAVLSMPMPKPNMVIDGPFMVWFTRPGLSKPLFTAFVDLENFKNPGSLD